MFSTFTSLRDKWASSGQPISYSSSSSSSSSSRRRRESEEKVDMTPERAQGEAQGYIQEAQKFHLLTTDQNVNLDKLFSSFRTLEAHYAKTAKTLRKRVTECNAVRTEHAIASLLLYQAFHSDFEKALTQGNRDEIFKCFLALDRAARRSLSINAQQIDLIRQTHAKAIDEIMPYVIQASSSLKKDVDGFRNAAGNCSINALLQMLFSAKPFLTNLIYAPELTELRKAYLQYCGLVEGTINSQTIRRELHELNDLISTSASRWEDAHEVLFTMSRYVPRDKAMASFPPRKEVREYEKEALITEDLAADDDINQRTTLQIGQDHAYMEKSLEPDFFVSVYPIARDRKKEANFKEQFYSIFDTDERGNGPASYLHPGDYTHLYTHKSIRSTRRYSTTPDFLIVVAERHRPGERINDTAMQMPRVLELPECAVEKKNIDRRLILRAFVVYQPGHYVSYIRRGDRWFYCSDSFVEQVSLKKVDQALYHTRSGGSYLHYYERPKNPSSVEQVPQMSPTPIIDERASTAQTKIAFELKKQLGRKNCSVDACVTLFMKLDKKLQFLCYELLLAKTIKTEGLKRLVLNPKALLPFLDSLGGDKAKELKALLEQEKVDLKAMAAVFTQFDFFQQLRCVRFLCKDFIQEEGIDVFILDPIEALTKRVFRLPVIEHLIDASKEQPPKETAKAKKMSQIEIADELENSAGRLNTTRIKQLVDQLDPKYRPEKIDEIDTRVLYLKVRDDLPVLPNATEIGTIINSVHEGNPPDVTAFDALITPEHVNDYWPGKTKQGTVSHYIVKKSAQIDHLRPLLEVLAKKGADFNLPDLMWKNTPLIWAMANANYDTASAILDLGSKYGTDFSLLKGGNSPIHLLLAKGYHSENRDGTQKFENVSGETLLRQLLIVAPELVNVIDHRGYTPLHLAALRRDLEFCRILAEHGADPTILGPNQETPLDMLDKTAKEATTLLERYTAKGAFLDVEKLDSFKEDLGPAMTGAIRGLFPPVGQLAIAFQLQAALEDPTSANLRVLYSKLDKKYLKKTTLADLKGNPDLMLGIITKIVDDQEKSPKKS